MATDGKGGYREALVATWGQVPDYCGQGRPPRCKQPQPDWQYVQVVLPLSVVDNSGILRSTSDDGQMQVLVTGSIDSERVCVSHSP